MCLELQKARHFRCLPRHLEHDQYCIILLSVESPSFSSDCRSLPFLPLFLLLQNNTENPYAEKQTIS